MAYTKEQRRIQRAIIEEGRRMKMPRKAILSALATGAVETNFSEPGEATSDRDSAGWRQERGMYYGGVDRMDERAAARRYYKEWRADAPKSGPIGPMAQAVQQSAFPDRYQEHAREARRIFRSFGGMKGGARGRGASRGTPDRLELTRDIIPGVNMGPQREALKMQTLSGSLLQGRMPSQEELLSMQMGVNALDDVPEEVRLGLENIPGKPGRQGGGQRGGGERIVTGTGRSVQRMLQMAEKWDKAKVPYLWGGGHGRIAKPGEQVDCSGFVSAVLGIDTPMVSGQLAKWGKPGKGRFVSVYANDGHVLMSIKDPRTKKVRWFGTSKSNPGGGAGEIAKPSASYLSEFTVRHPG